MNNYTPTDVAMPPKDTLIEWVSPSGQIVLGKWLGGGIWMPQGSEMYVYYRPVYWRLAP